MKNVLIISTSPRKGGNSESLALEFAKGAQEAGNKVEAVFFREKNIGFCKGCLACTKTNRCVIKDDAAELVEKMLAADVIAFATPIYYYEMSGQMKTLLDRGNPMYSADYAFRDIYLISTAAENGADVPKRAVNGLDGWIECFPKAHLAGTVFAGGVNAVGDIKGHSAMNEAYEMGKAIL
ncbi:MAG: flavodoxin family protein [Ruminiclostridium sp.]